MENKADAENGFFQQVYAIVAQIPAGQTLSYGEIARMLGRPRAARMVGWAMRRCPDGLPWHRVIRADGSIAEGGEAGCAGPCWKRRACPSWPDGRVDRKALWEKQENPHL